MNRLTWLVVLYAAVGFVAEAPGQSREEDDRWTVYVANDNCPDYTWGYSEEQTRRAFADIVKGHLDRSYRTYAPPGSRYQIGQFSRISVTISDHLRIRSPSCFRRVMRGNTSAML